MGAFYALSYGRATAPFWIDAAPAMKWEKSAFLRATRGAWAETKRSADLRLERRNAYNVRPEDLTSLKVFLYYLAPTPVGRSRQF
jgi:hypothetical protein